jgi:RHS repeat-associated protein
MNAVENPDSNTKHIHYNSATGAFKGMVSSEVDYLGSNTTSYTYSNGHCSDSTGCVNSTQTTNVTYADGEVDQDTYSSSILLEDTYGPSYTGPGVVSWNYDWTFPTAQNQPTTDVINYPDGATATAVEDAAGQITSFTNAAGNYVNSMYNDTGGNDLDELCWSALQGVAVSASNSCDSPPAGATTYTYDSTGHELSQTDPMGNMTRHGYYANGLLCWTAEPTVTGPGGPCAGSTPSGAAPGGATAYEYDSYGDQTATIVDYGASSPPETTSNYDTNGELLYVIPPDGQGSGGFGSNPYETAYSYYENGLTESVTAPLSRTTSYTYDAAGNELTETDPAGVTTNTYTADNQVCWTLRSTAASGNACGTAPTGSTHYGGYLADTDAPTDIVDPNGNTSTIAYADEAYPTSPTLNDDVSNSGAEESFTAYDSLGNACLTGPGDPYTGGTPPCQATSGDTYKQYNDVGQLQSTTDPSSVVTSYSYADGAYPLEPTTVTYGSGSSEEITDIGYDPAGRQLYTYDSEGNYVTTADDSDGRVCWSGPSGEGYTWLADNFISPANNLCSDVPSGTGISTFGYNADDQRSSMVDNYGTAQQTSPPDAYTYDADGNLTSASDDNGRTVSYQYDDAAEMTCMAYPVLASPNCQNSPSSTNSVVDYGYNGAGQMTSSQDWLGNTVTDTGYNALSELGKITYPTTASAGSEKVSYTYGNAGNLTKTAYAGPVLNGDDDTYTPNPDEQLASMTGLDSFTSASDTYDSYQRASKATNPATGSGNAAVNTFQYNSDGTISQDLPQSHSAITFAYNGSDQLTSITNPNTTAPYNKPATSKYAYTGDGQRCWSAPGTTTGTCTTAPTGATSYGWNNLGQMCWSGATTSSTSACSSPPSGTTTYTYDGDGLRMTETPSSGAALSFTWDTDASVPLVVDDGTNAYIYGPTLFGGTAPVEQIKISTKAVTWLASTPSGVQTAFLEVGGTEKEQAAYTTYGTLVLQASTSNVSPFGFQGSYTDKSGLIYLVNRYYDPLTDQFISADPMMAKTGQPYAFTADDPLNGSDPVGLFRAGVGGQQCGGGPDPTCNTGNQGGPVTVPQGAPGGEGPSGGSPSPAVGSTPYGGVSVTRAGPTEVIPVGAAARVTVTSSLTISGRNSNPHVSVETDGTLDISEGDSSAQISPDGAIEGVGQGIGGQGVYLCATAGGGGICYQAPPISYDLGTGAHISATITAEYGPNPSPGTRQTLEAAGVVVTVAGIAAVVVGCGLFDTVTGSGLCPIPGTQ